MNGGGAFLYLHGLASSPKGRKRAMLERRFEAEGWKIVAPDLNVPSFRELSFVEMVRTARSAHDEARPAVVVGSSLGALVSLSLAESLGSGGPPLVLVAPALGFGERWKPRLPEGDVCELFHHGEGRALPIRRAFFEEMAGVNVDEAPPPVPVSIVMGTHDESVPFDQVARAWARWEGSGFLVSGSRFHRVEGGDHGLVEFGDSIEAAVRERLAG
ncbi:MAG TPA: YqiA/YcfP family alpha/beta fold hydrolase [Thermoanaerobaculia bacterium]|nr:YqiA/YcfP family alpha/beta fold hydrolase [Thermoanaerobaculia bacterium]